MRWPGRVASRTGRAQWMGVGLGPVEIAIVLAGVLGVVGSGVAGAMLGRRGLREVRESRGTRGRGGSGPGCRPGLAVTYFGNRDAGGFWGGTFHRIGGGFWWMF